MSQNAITPIETIYKGYRFRSRLEARWAVFFDSLGVEWEYEKEGYDLGELGWYLPDFWLPQFRLFLEVKPNVSFQKDIACKKAEMLRNITDYPVAVAVGLPADHLWLRYAGYCRDKNGFMTCNGYAVFAEGLGGVFLLVFDAQKSDNNEVCYDESDVNFCTGDTRGFEIISRIKNMKEAKIEFSRALEDWISENVLCVYAESVHTLITKASIKARQARFEHGECGAKE